MKTIPRQRSIIPACDMLIDPLEQLVRQTHDLDVIGAYKVGFTLGLTYGLPKVVDCIRHYTDKPIIYDHQKSGSDIPETGKIFAQTLKHANIDMVIHFSHTGPATQRAWIEASLEAGLLVIVGGLMTHQAYVRSEGGYFADEAILEMYTNAAKWGVTHFVVPGNKPDAIKEIREALVHMGIDPTFYAPGFVAQGGSISESGSVAGDHWHAIVGRGIYEADDFRAAAIEYGRQL